MAFDLARFAQEFGVALLIVALLIGMVAFPMANQGLDTVSNVATSIGYNLTAQAAVDAKSNIQTGLFLMLIGILLYPIIALLRKGPAVSVVRRVYMFAMGLIFLSILVFRLALPKLIETQLFADGDMALLVTLIGFIVVITGIGGLVVIGYRALKAKEKKEEPVLVVK
jgi:hypothetical protein